MEKLESGIFDSLNRLCEEATIDSINIEQFVKTVDGKLQKLRTNVILKYYLDYLNLSEEQKNLSFWYSFEGIEPVLWKHSDSILNTRREKYFLLYYYGEKYTFYVAVFFENRKITNVKVEINSYGVYDYKLHGYDCYGYVENLVGVSMEEADIMKSRYKDIIDIPKLVDQLRLLM